MMSAGRLWPPAVSQEGTQGPSVARTWEQVWAERRGGSQGQICVSFPQVLRGQDWEPTPGSQLQHVPE